MSNKSEIYKQGYEPWKGERTPPEPLERFFRHPSLLIGRMSLQNTTFLPKSCLLRLVAIIFIGFPLMGYFFIVIVSSIVRFQIENLKQSDMFGDFAKAMVDIASQADLNATEAEIQMNLILLPSLIFTVFAMVFYGSQLISREKQANALQVYFSKALTRNDYVLGKFVAVGTITAIFTLLPSAIIILLGLTLSTDFFAFVAEAWYIPIMTGVYWLLLSLVMGGISLAASSLFNRFYLAAVGFIGFSIFCGAASALLSILFGSPAMLEGMNWTDGLYDIGKAIYTGKDFGSSLFFWQVVDIGVITAGAFFLLYRNIRPVEVIK